MVFTFAAVLALIVIGIVAFQFMVRVRQLHSADVHVPMPVADRYRPMLRLLSDDDAAFVPANSPLAKQFRARRVSLFREYLRCLTKDYGRLLSGIRMIMLRSDTDRPDLARALAVNQFRFLMALCRIEVRLFMHTAGIGTVDVSGLVEAMEALRNQVAFLTPSFGQAR